MWIALGLLGRPIRDVACGFGRTKATTPEHVSIDLKSRIPLSGAILSCQLWVTKHILGRFSAKLQPASAVRASTFTALVS